MERWVVIIDEIVPSGMRPERWWEPVREFLKERYPKAVERVGWNHKGVKGLEQIGGGYGIARNGRVIEYLHEFEVREDYKKIYSSTVRWERNLKEVLG